MPAVLHSVDPATATRRSRSSQAESQSIRTEWDLLGMPRVNSETAERLLRRGFDVSSIDRFVERSQLPRGAVLKAMKLTATELKSRAVSKLTEEEATRLWRIARVTTQAVLFFKGDVSQAAAWLQAQQFSLGKRTPLMWASTEPGAAEVNELLMRLEFGVFP